jgi:hypothetical protein
MRRYVNKASVGEAGFAVDSTVSSYLLDGVKPGGRRMLLAGTYHRGCGMQSRSWPVPEKVDADKQAERPGHASGPSRDDTAESIDIHGHDRANSARCRSAVMTCAAQCTTK